MLREFKATDFRCLAMAEICPDPQFNLIYGSNASGKTSVLEAIAYLGRGKSFRGAPTQSLIRHGASEFLLFANVEDESKSFGIGARNGPAGLEVSVAGERGGGAAALATAFPLQVIDPEVHSLVAGGPEERRRFLDWIVFHVEPSYGTLWRRYRRALKQRNAALKSGNGGVALDGWDKELAELGDEVHGARTRVLAYALPTLSATALGLVQSEIRFEYRCGWPDDLSLAEALTAGRGRDLLMGSTQAGPHRGDVRLIYNERQARRLVSRGQQKLLACAMILAATEVAQLESRQSVLLLLDDPAAELDASSLARLMERVVGLGCQVIATSLVARAELFPQRPAMFHVEHGALRRAP